LQLYAHRGANLALPENTMEAFRQGLLDGATALEMDVRVTSDAVVVVFHDNDGWRMAREKKLVSQTSWEEMRRWDVKKGSRFSPLQMHFMNQVFRVPLLAEILDAFPQIFLNIDIKSHNLRSVWLVVELIRKYQATERVRLTSFSWRVHQMLHDLRYEGSVGLSRLEVACVYSIPEVFLQSMRLRGRAIQIPMTWGFIGLDQPQFIAKCHRLGLTVDYWTINNQEDARKLIKAGADGIMSDDPATILTVLA
jgi:glycerophosphoryl diester phosphodiesterase